MWTKAMDTIRDYQLIKPGDCVVVGLSGGADSVCLLRLCDMLRKEWAISPVAVHVNHQIRGDAADEDEAFVRNLCETMEVPLLCFSIDVPALAREKKCSMEEAGRDARYTCFNKVAKKYPGAVIAVAHHENDLVETMIFRMIRGTGISGMAAMVPKNGNVIRPLLFYQRREIEEILENLRQDFRSDETNEDFSYTRNIIRHQIIPVMEDINPGAVAHMAELADKVLELERYIKPQIKEAAAACITKKEEHFEVELSLWRTYPAYIRSEIMRELLFKAAGRERDITGTHIDMLTELAGKTAGKKISLPYGLTAVRENHGIAILIEGSLTEELTKQDYETVPVTVPGEVIFGDGRRFQFSLVSKEEADFGKNDCVKYFDYDKIKRNLCIRTRRDEDYFILDQEGHRKMLRRYMIDEKIPAAKRDSLPLLCEGSHVLWIVGGRISSAYKVTEDTGCVLKAVITDVNKDMQEDIT